MILIVSSHTDVHAAAVLRELNTQGAAATLLDLSNFPTQMQLSLHYTSDGDQNFRIQFADGQSLALADCRAIWWRRPQPFILSAEVSRDEYRLFALNESQEAFTGLWQSLDVFWVNHPTRDSVAHRKVFQLGVARAVGLTIPRTLITNDPEEVQLFIEAQGHENVIYKAFSATEQDWRETRLLGTEELAVVQNVRYAPVIFQEYIEARADLRVTIVGKQLFPAAIYSQETAYKVDFRMDIANARMEAVELPSAVEEQLFSLMDSLGLVYGAIDMRLTPDGRYVFLEINPAGQWLFIEQRTGQPVTAALATLLARRGAGH